MDWLFKEDDYKPPEDKNPFIDRTILSVLKVLAKIEGGSHRKSGRIYEVSPSLKLTFIISFIVFLSITRSIIIMEVMAGIILLAALFLKREDKKKLGGLEIGVFFITLLMLLPSMMMGNLKNSLIILGKVLATTTMVNILSLTSRWSDMVRALKLFRVPDVFIFVFEITLKYIYLLGRIVEDALEALKLRSIGKNQRKYSSLSSIMGNLFLKSREMGDEMHSAMECRGFTGEYGSGGQKND
jgi:cobalt/nickel transport system permease protein